jgi:hypothetical protein
VSGVQDERSALTAVLLGQTGSPQGPRPTAQDLAAWARGRLSGQRRIEVESHIALDPDVFAEAMRRLRSEGRTVGPGFAVRAVRALGAWIAQPIPALGTGALAIGLLALLGFFLRAPTGLGGGTSTPVLRGEAPTTPADWRVVAFRAGYWQEEAVVAADHADERTDAAGCVDEDGCSAQVRELVNFGERLAHLNTACVNGLDAAQRAVLADELARIEDAMAGSLELLPWRGYAHALADDLRTDPTRACERADSLRSLLVAAH